MGLERQVHSAEALGRALSQADPGDTLVLAPGAYKGAWTVQKSVALRRAGEVGWPELRAPAGQSVFTVTGDATLQLDGLDFVGGLSVRAGALRLDGGELTADNCRFMGHRALLEGGAVFVSAGDLQLRRCFFERNRALAGAALYLAPGSRAQVQDSGFSGNRARCGGAIAVDGARCDVRGSFFQDNRAAYNGSAVAVRGASSLTVHDCTLGHGQRSPGIVAEGQEPSVRTGGNFTYGGEGEPTPENPSGRSLVWVAPATRLQALKRRLGGDRRLRSHS